MQVAETFRKKIIPWYCILFYVLMLYNWANGLFLYQLRPFLFYTRADFTSWFFMQAGLHRWLLNNQPGCILFDVSFYSAPLVLFIMYRRFKRFTSVAAAYMLVVNFTYLLCYSLYPSNSMEGKIAWLFFPVVFLPGTAETFVLLFKGLRYYFLFFFASAGMWKIRQGGVFHTDQMAGILLQQHKYMLALSPNNWYAALIYWFVQHPAVPYLLYLTACLLQLSFITGFFTTKYDRRLAAVFVIFLLMDNFIMGITYYNTTPLLLTLLFSEQAKNIDLTRGKKLQPAPTINTTNEPA